MKSEESDCHPVSNFLLIKKLVDGGNDDLVLVGTIVQKVFRAQSQIEAEEDAPQDNPDNNEVEYRELKEFAMRFNDESDSNYSVLRRRKEKVTSDGKEYLRSTYNVKLPLFFDVVLDSFPFVIKKATVTIELSTDDDRFRPTLLLDTTERRNNVAIQECTHDDARIKLDRIIQYDLISPYPEVEFMWDNKKKYCPKYNVSFYVTESGPAKFLKITVPVFLIATMNTVNVLLQCKCKIDAPDFLSNSATIALTAVFAVSGVVTQQPAKTPLFSLNLAYIMTVFLGLLFSSIPSNLLKPDEEENCEEENCCNCKISFSGMIIVWSSFAFPLINLVYFLIKRNKIVCERNNSNAIKSYVNDDNKEDADKYCNYKLAKDIIEDSEQDPSSSVKRLYKVQKGSEMCREKRFTYILYK